MKFLIILEVVALYCTDEVLPQTTTSGVAGVDMNVIVPCSIIAADYDPGSDGAFWKINGSVYGPLQVPSGFSVCDEISCDLASLVIPVLQREMNGSTIQCVGIDYHNNTQYLGGVTVLEVIPLPQGQLNRNVSLQDGPVERAVLDYSQFSIGPVNTTIGWTYSNLTCYLSVFIIQGYADSDDIPDNPSLNLTSTSSVLTFPTNITNGSLYWRLLAHDVAGTPCAQESVYFQTANDTTPIPISPSSDGVGCVPISVGPRHDYSSLEVVWPERRDTVGRLCYCPPFEGEHHLFSRCISTTSCDTDYSITVSNGSVCFAELSPPLSSIPVYFTLLESCYMASTCLIRSMVAYYIIEMDPEQNTPNLISRTTAGENLASNNYRSVDTKDDNSTVTEIPETKPEIPILLIVSVFACIVLLLLLFFLIATMCCCYKKNKLKQTFDLQQSQGIEDNFRTERAYEMAPNGDMRTDVEATKVTPHATRETPPVAYDIVQSTNIRSSSNIEPTSAQESQGDSACNDPHRVYHILTNENKPPTNGRYEGPVAEGHPLELETADLSSVYEVVSKKDLPTSPDIKAAVYSALDHTKPQVQQKTGKQEKEDDYNTLQHAKNSRLAHSVSDSRVLLKHVPPTAVYETIDKPKTPIATALPGQPVYSTLGAPKYSLVNKRSKSTSAVEGLRKKAAGKHAQAITVETSTAEVSTPGVPYGNRNPDTVGATIPEETGESCRGTASQAEDNTESKHVRKTSRSTNKLPNYEVVSKQNLSSTAGDAIYSALDHTKPRSRKTSQESDTYNSLQHARNSKLAHSVSDSRVLLMSLPPTVVYETIDTSKAARAAALPGQPVYSTVGTPKYSMADKKSKSTSAMEGLRKAAATGLDNSSAAERSGVKDCAFGGIVKVGSNSTPTKKALVSPKLPLQSSPSTNEPLGGTLVSPKMPPLKEVYREKKPSGKMCSPLQPLDYTLPNQQ